MEKIEYLIVHLEQTFANLIYEQYDLNVFALDILGEIKEIESL